MFRFNKRGKKTARKIFIYNVAVVFVFTRLSYRCRCGTRPWAVGRLDERGGGGTRMYRDIMGNPSAIKKYTTRGLRATRKIRKKKIYIYIVFSNPERSRIRTGRASSNTRFRRWQTDGGDEEEYKFFANDGNELLTLLPKL